MGRIERAARAICREMAPEIVREGSNISRYVEECWLDCVILAKAALDAADSE
jgi:hypothetical protein